MRIDNNYIWIVDSTLRDGEQTPGISFSRHEKISIASMLADSGVDELEVGIPAMGKSECRDISEIIRLNLPCRITSWCRARKEDLILAAQCGTRRVHIGFPVSPILISVMNKTESRVLEELEDLVSYALTLFDEVSVGAMDLVRADIRFLNTFVQAAYRSGAYRVRLADTVGLGTPSGIARIVTTLIATENRLIYEFHGHNDLGMATANAISAAEAGAGAISTTINGLGERAGNAPLEEVVAALTYGTDKRCGINPADLVSACTLVSQVSKRPIAPYKPVTGRDVFNHESGIHCHGIIKDPISFQPFKPESVGHTPGEIVVGKHSGTASVCHILAKAGISIDRHKASEMIDGIRSFARLEGRTLTESELVSLYHACESV